MKLTDRQAKAYSMRQSGFSYAAIAVELGVCSTRARQLVQRAEGVIKGSPFTGLSTRASYWLLRKGFKNKAGVKEGILSGTLYYKNKGNRNVGIETYREVCKWVGILMP